MKELCKKMIRMPQGPHRGRLTALTAAAILAAAILLASPISNAEANGPPATPVKVSINTEDGFPLLRWTTPPGPQPTGHRIHRTSPDQPATASVAILPGVANSYQDRTASPGFTYIYQVTAVNESGESNRSPPLRTLGKSSTTTNKPQTRAIPPHLGTPKTGRCPVGETSGQPTSKNRHITDPLARSWSSEPSPKAQAEIQIILNQKLDDLLNKEHGPIQAAKYEKRGPSPTLTRITWLTSHHTAQPGSMETAGRFNPPPGYIA